MKKTMFLPRFAATLLAVCTAAAASAQPARAGTTLGGLLADPVAKKSFTMISKGHPLPAWVMQGGAQTPGVAVSMGNKSYEVLTACKPHACDSEKIALMYEPTTHVMYGLLARASKGQESLTWLNIGGGAESIDGKTILYAALTGSLSNHPTAFNFR